MSENDFMMENFTTRVTRSLRKRINSFDDDTPTQKKTPLKALNTIVEDEKRITPRTPKVKLRRISIADEGSVTPTKTPGRRVTRRTSTSESLDILPEPSPVRKTRRQSINSEEVPGTPTSKTPLRSKRLSVSAAIDLTETLHEENEELDQSSKIDKDEKRRITRSVSKSPNVSPKVEKIVTPPTKSPRKRGRPPKSPKNMSPPSTETQKSMTDYVKIVTKTPSPAAHKVNAKRSSITNDMPKNSPNLKNKEKEKETKASPKTPALKKIQEKEILKSKSPKTPLGRGIKTPSSSAKKQEEDVIIIDDHESIETSDLHQKTNSPENELLNNDDASAKNEETKEAQNSSKKETLDATNENEDVSDLMNESLNKTSESGNNSLSKASKESKEDEKVISEETIYDTPLKTTQNEENMEENVVETPAMEDRNDSVRNVTLEKPSPHVSVVEKNTPEKNDLKSTEEADKEIVENSQQQTESSPEMSKTEEDPNKSHNSNSKQENEKPAESLDSLIEFPKSWSNAVVVNTSNQSNGNFIDAFQVNKKKEVPEDTKTSSVKKPKNKRVRQIKSDSEEYSDDSEPERKQHEFVDDEAMEVDDDDIESLSSEERQYLKDNEVPERAESIGSEDTEEDVFEENEESEDMDSFIVSDEEFEKISINSEEEELEAENGNGNKRLSKKRRITVRPTELSSSEDDEKTSKPQQEIEEEKVVQAEYSELMNSSLQAASLKIKDLINSENQKVYSISSDMDEEVNVNKADAEVTKDEEAIDEQNASAKPNMTNGHITISEDNSADVNNSSKNEEFESCDNESFGNLTKNSNDEKLDSGVGSNVSTNSKRKSTDNEKITEENIDENKDQEVEENLDNIKEVSNDESLENQSLHMSLLFQKTTRKSNIYTSRDDSNDKVESQDTKKLLKDKGKKSIEPSNETVNETLHLSALFSKKDQSIENSDDITDNAPEEHDSDGTDNNEEAKEDQINTSQEKKPRQKVNESMIINSLHLSTMFNESSMLNRTITFSKNEEDKSSSETISTCSEDDSQGDNKKSPSKCDENKIPKINLNLTPFPNKKMHSTPLRLDQDQKKESDSEVKKPNSITKGKNPSNSKKHSSFKESLLSKEDKFSLDKLLEKTFSNSLTDKCETANFMKKLNASLSSKDEPPKDKSVEDNTNESADEQSEQPKKEEKDKKLKKKMKKLMKIMDENQTSPEKKEKKNKYKRDKEYEAKEKHTKIQNVEAPLKQKSKRLPEDLLESVAQDSETSELKNKKSTKKLKLAAENIQKVFNDEVEEDDDDSTSAFEVYTKNKKQKVKENDKHSTTKDGKTKLKKQRKQDLEDSPLEQKYIHTTAGQFKVSKPKNQYSSESEEEHNDGFIESDFVKSPPKKKKLKIITHVPSGIIREEPVTPKSQKIINGFQETDLTPKPLGVKVESILSPLDTPLSKAEKRKKAKRKLNIEEPTSVLPKRVWTSAGEFTVTETTSVKLNTSSTSTEFIVAPLEKKKSKKGSSYLNTIANSSALDFKQNAMYNNKIIRESSKDLINRKLKQKINKKM